ncbi:NUDIX hydrolase [Streptomyces sp. V3I7]|uniref:NUDIX hydrolase n=1 Tax=Streptomyces sp. V3I7 TaxID=3042278 RepID=UPI002781541E|nr:NUDIX hydrolase [Streptomyces sp. V3I7]MDQ0989655.1 8-oxo-dGTP pyrophosphatase MutT (NUDIX family) [Streptomyces sp. V3I7]
MTCDQGRTPPLPPHEYILTLPHLTAYACLYVRDKHNHPVQLRSVFGARPWQLTGGTVEATDASPEETLRREAIEEAQVPIGDDIVRLGWVHDATGEVYGGIGPCARLRLTAPVTQIGPTGVDPATGRVFARLLATPDQAAALLGWARAATSRPASPPAGRTNDEACPTRRKSRSANFPRRDRKCLDRLVPGTASPRHSDRASRAGAVVPAPARSRLPSTRRGPVKSTHVTAHSIAVRHLSGIRSRRVPTLSGHRAGNGRTA